MPSIRYKLCFADKKLHDTAIFVSYVDISGFIVESPWLPLKYVCKTVLQAFKCLRGFASSPKILNAWVQVLNSAVVWSRKVAVKSKAEYITMKKSLT